MRLDEAYMRWGSESQNRELYKKTKDVFRKATWRPPTRSWSARSAAVDGKERSLLSRLLN